jgi:hypothetical protein
MRTRSRYLLRQTTMFLIRDNCGWPQGATVKVISAHTVRRSPMVAAVLRTAGEGTER